jgi:hypothetical protein
MNPEFPRWSLPIMVFLLAFLSTGFCAEENNGTPYYRFWRGFKKDGMAWEEFHKALVTDFMPATVNTLGREGLVSYLVVLPIGSGSGNIPEEVALVGYVSEEIYKTASNTPHGKAYQQKHGDIFKTRGNSQAEPNEIPGQSRFSRSLVPIDFESVSPEHFRKEAAYDVLFKPVDWQTGYSVFFMGLRNPSLRPDFFWDAMYKHVKAVKTAYSPMGLQGYVVLIDPNYEMAFMNWTSKATMEKAMQSPQGKSLENDVSNILTPLIRKEFRDFDGNVQPGECVNYKFVRP